MRAGIRIRVFLATAVPVLVTAGTLGLYLDDKAEKEVTLDASATLDRFSGVVVELVRTRSLDDRKALQKAVESLGRAADIRVTIISSDGKVLADSKVPADRVDSMDNHGKRPEILQAKRHGTGRSIRYSHTLGAPLMYLARRVDLPRGPVFVRMALPMAELVRRQGEQRNALLLTVVAALLLAGTGTFLMSAHVLSRLRRIRDGAVRIAAGDFDARIDVAGNDEMKDLADSLNRMARACRETFDRLEDESQVQSTILESMKEGLLTVSPDGRITSVNAATLRMTSFTGDPVGLAPSVLLRTPELLEALEEALHGREVQCEVAVAHPRSKTLLATAAPLPGRKGAVMVLHDTTEIHRLHRVRRDFVANVSHELRNPLATIQAAAETLQELQPSGSSGEDRDRLVDTIVRQSARMSSLVNDLLDLSLIESGQLEVRPVVVDLDEALRTAASSFEETAVSRGLSIEVRVHPDAARCVCDRSGLQTVLSNLLDNAVKYTRRGDAITLSTAPSGKSTVEIEVADTGPGIPGKHLARLFERFYRVDKGRSRDVGGTGLGLAIVKHLVAVMDGKIRVQSEVGRGTSFIVTLPDCESNRS